MSSKYWLGFILLAAFFLRLYGLTNPVYDLNYWRQTETAALAMNYYDDRPPFLYPEIDWVGPHGHAEMEFPIFPYLVARLYDLFAPADMWGRALSLLFSLFTVWTLWDIGRFLGNTRIGLFAAAFFAASPLAVFFGRTFQPDMMMVFFSTLAISLLLRWQGGIKESWLYTSALSLALALLLKPPSLIVLFPLLWIFTQKQGNRFFFYKECWIYAVTFLIPPLLWYAHARGFYLETGATFMWHYKDFDFQRVIGSLLIDPHYWKIVAWRIGDQILYYLGLLPFIIGLISLFFSLASRWFYVLWFFGMLMLYLGVPGHHVGHDYYSLLVVPPCALLAALGTETLATWVHTRWKFIPPTAWLLLPAAIAALGFTSLIQRGWYSQLYFYYDDAVTLQETIPEDSLILVMDELPHTPEFFYFINRNGWHRMRNAHDGVDDSLWVETMREQGAHYYVGLNESPGNFPFSYVQYHMMGNYLRDHYQIETIGARFFVANLNKPIFGDHLFSQYKNQTMAVPMSLWDKVSTYLADVVPLREWYLADTILFDFHTLTQERLSQYQEIYSVALKDGFRVAHQESGRILLERDLHIQPVTHVLDQIQTTALTPASIDDGIVNFGSLSPGPYRISFDFDPPNLSNPYVLHVVSHDEGTVIQRKLDPPHLKHLAQGEKPEVFINIKDPSIVKAYITSGDQYLIPNSVVCMPDVQCVSPPMVIQAEDLLSNQTRMINDNSADRGSAVYAKTDDQGRIVLYGPFFHFPNGHYQAAFRLKAPNPDKENELVIGVTSPNDTVQENRVIHNDELSQDYQDYTVQGEFTLNDPIETRVSLKPHSEIIVDTITIHHLKRALFPLSTTDEAFLLVRNGKPYKLTRMGHLFNEHDEEHSQHWLEVAPIAAGSWNPHTGTLVLNEQGCLFNQELEQLGCLDDFNPHSLVAMDISPDGNTVVVLMKNRDVYVWTNNQWQSHTVPDLSHPVRDILAFDGGTALVLYGNAEIRAVGDLEIPKEIPTFDQDVCRALVRAPGGVYVVDCAGAFHESKGVPSIMSEVYRLEDWVAEAARTEAGLWILYSHDDKIYTFSE